MLRKIISGGQTGADQAGLDAAIRFNVGYGGYIPLGRRTERGPLSSKYKGMVESETSDYRVRTRLNILNSDGTVVFTYGLPTGGSSLTLQISLAKGKTTIHVDLDKVSKQSAVVLIRDWIHINEIEILNVAGSRRSHAPNIYDDVFFIIAEVLEWELINKT